MGCPSALDERVGTEESMHALYYSLEVLRNNQSIYNYEVLGRGTLRQVIDNFGNGNGYYDVRLDDVIKIYHPQKSPNSSIVMIDEEERDFTYDSEYAYYRVTAFGLEPIPVMEAERTSQTFSLMDDVSTLDVKELVKNVTINHQSISEDRYTIEQVSEIDTSTTGKRTTKVKITMNDGLAETEIEVPYEVQWGSTFVLRGLEEMTVGAFSLLKEGDQFTIHASPGSSNTDLNRPVNNPFGREIYYAIEVLENDTRKYTKEFRRNMLMEDEQEKNFTYGSQYAYYEVTEYGFEPSGKIDVEANKVEIPRGATDLDLKSFIKNVKVNDKVIPENIYTVSLNSEIDTSTPGRNNVAVNVTTDSSYGGFSTELNMPYEVRDHTTNSSTNESQNNHTNNEDTSGSTERNEGTTPSIQDDPTTSADNESSLNMPQTNATRNTAWTLIGIALVAGIGAIVMRRKTKEKAENQ